MSTEPAITVKYQAYQLKHVNHCLLLIKIPVEMSTRVIFEVENGNLCDLTFTQSKSISGLHEFHGQPHSDQEIQ